MIDARHHHAHDFHQLAIDLEGNAEFKIEGLGGTIAPLSGCIVPTDHMHYYAGIGHNHQLIVNLPKNTPPLSSSHHALSQLFEVPRFFTLDSVLPRYLDFLMQELEISPRQADNVSSWHNELMSATLLSSLLIRLVTDRPTLSHAFRRTYGYPPSKLRKVGYRESVRRECARSGNDLDESSKLMFLD